MNMDPGPEGCGCSKMCLVVGEDCDRGISERKFGRDCGLNPIHGFRALWHSSKRSCVMRRIVHAKRGMPVRSPKSSRGAAFVAMMQATNLRESDNVSRDGWVYGARFRTILVKREMGSGLVMILKIRRQNPAQLALIEDDDVIETFAAD